ncbi:MAG: hypothetical protein HPY76_04220 [Anaerolineae bacterium]|nr:hypothetical protein [Anaerolineae bacterium]
MNDYLQISAKNLGSLALPSACDRCTWIRLHAKKLPYQIFPGIFSSIDAYSKKIQAAHYQRESRLLPWFVEAGLNGEPLKAPHWKAFNIVDEQSAVILTGMPDEVLALEDGSYAIIDYKTSKFTKGQDSLMPMYEVQLNAYAYIGERLDLNPVSRLVLAYYEPQTDAAAISLDDVLQADGFWMGFAPHLVDIPLRTENIESLLWKARSIYDLPTPPEKREGCEDCAALDNIFELLR